MSDDKVLRYAQIISTQAGALRLCIDTMKELRLEASGESERASRVAVAIHHATEALALPALDERVLCAERHTLYAIRRNTDATEGRGFNITVGVADMEATALRLARGIDVQGCDGKVNPFKVMRDQHGHDWIPLWAGHAAKVATPEDIRRQKELDERKAVVEKAKALGLSDIDIAVLRG